LTDTQVRIAGLGLVLTLGLGLLQAQPAQHPSAPPVLNEPKSLTGMNLDFTHGARLGDVFLNLGKQSGVSIILHASVLGQEISTTSDLRGMNFQRALDTLLLQNDLFYTVMDPTSIMVFKKTPRNLQEFETRVIKVFNLSNADVDAVRQTINALMPHLRVFIDKRLNALTVSGTSSELANVSQVVKNLDRGRGEVRLQMEVVEVPHKATAATGLLRLVGAPPSQEPGSAVPDPALAKAMPALGGKLLACPDMRVVAGESAEVRISMKPALTRAASGARTTPNPTKGKAVDSREATQGDEPGLRIKVKPRLHPDHGITLDVEYELADPLLGGEPGGPALSQRRMKTTVRIKDGETVAFGGLLEEEKGDAAPGRARGGKERNDHVLVVKAMVVRWGEQ
jgi:general secretion pathway protein D